MACLYHAYCPAYKLWHQTLKSQMLHTHTHKGYYWNDLFSTVTYHGSAHCTIINTIMTFPNTISNCVPCSGSCNAHKYTWRDWSRFTSQQRRSKVYCRMYMYCTIFNTAVHPAAFPAFSRIVMTTSSFPILMLSDSWHHKWNARLCPPTKTGDTSF